VKMNLATKRFYRRADLVASEDGYRILLDDRTMKTPAGADFLLPTQALARAVVAEWLAQADVIRPETLLATRLAATAIDMVSIKRQAVVDQLAGCAEFDLLFYRAADPPELALRQNACWQPLLDWAQAVWRVSFNVTSGVMPVKQPDGTVEALASAVSMTGDMELTGIASITQASGSLIIALALAGERIDAAAACEAALLDESYQSERWGQVAEATERRQRLKDDIIFADRFIAWCRDVERSDGSAGRNEESIH
jgi:chaperone required for assembly of F1-ATPase